MIRTCVVVDPAHPPKKNPSIPSPRTGVMAAMPRATAPALEGETGRERAEASTCGTFSRSTCGWVCRGGEMRCWWWARERRDTRAKVDVPTNGTYLARGPDVLELGLVHGRAQGVGRERRGALVGLAGQAGGAAPGGEVLADIRLPVRLLPLEGDGPLADAGGVEDLE